MELSVDDVDVCLIVDAIWLLVISVIIGEEFVVVDADNDDGEVDVNVDDKFVSWFDRKIDWFFVAVADVAVTEQFDSCFLTWNDFVVDVIGIDDDVCW